MCCARCGKPLVVPRACRGHAGATASHRVDDSNANNCYSTGNGLGGFPEFIELEDWELEETIRQAEQLVRSVTSEQDIASGRSRGRAEAVHVSRRTDASHAVPTSAAMAGALPKSSGTLPWLILALGLGLFVCGAALMGLSLTQQRTILWQLGLPMVLGGQVAVLFVVIWQLEVVWHSNRATFVALHGMDEQLRHLRSESPGGNAERNAQLPFYRHLSEGASPHVLLEDLKQQIDVLSLHLTPDKRAA